MGSDGVGYWSMDCIAWVVLLSFALADERVFL